MQKGLELFFQNTFFNRPDDFKTFNKKRNKCLLAKKVRLLILFSFQLLYILFTFINVNLLSLALNILI